jgi:hypothetical protein
MTTQPLTFTTRVPQGKVSPNRRAMTPDTKKRDGVPTMAPKATIAPPISSSDKDIAPIPGFSSVYRCRRRAASASFSRGLR